MCAKAGIGCPVCPLPLRPFVPLWLASACSQDSPDAASPQEKRRFSTVLLRPSQQEHTQSPAQHIGTHYLKGWQEGGKRAETLWELLLPLFSFHFFLVFFLSFLHLHTHIPFFFSRCSLRSFGDCASGLCSPMMNDLPKNTVCMWAHSIQVEELTCTVRNQTTFRPLFYSAVCRLTAALNMRACVC